MASVVALCAIGGCGGDDDADPRPAERSKVVAEHVGKTQDRELFVAVALDAQGKVKGYVCDGRGHGAAFDGTTGGDRVELRSADGAARLTADLGAEPLVGTIDFRGERRPFRLSKAAGIGGLYTFHYATPETFTARSERGNEIDGRQTQDRVSAVVTTAGGDSRPLTSRLGRGPASQRGYREYRVILLDDGDFRGNRLSGSAQLTSPNSLRNRPIISPA